MYNTENFLEPEIIDGFKVTEKRKRIWKIEIELLQAFDKFCKEFNIKYCVAGGTLLGAVRHKGFIPWDDDIDVVVFRDDYERLVRIAPKFFDGEYYFQSYINEESYDRPHSQLRNSNTTAILKSEINNRKSFNQGIFIDIFPLDGVPYEPEKRNSFIKQVIKQKRRIEGFVNYDNYKKHSTLGEIKQFFLSMLGLKRMMAIYNKKCAKYSIEKNNLVSDFAFLLDRAYIYDKNAWKEVDYLEFEYIKVPVPKKYDYVLKEQYGNYSEFIIGNSEHGDVFFDTEKPYTYYLNEGREELEKYATTEH